MKLQTVTCPVCSSRLIDTMPGTITEARPIKRAADWPAADYYPKCWRCKHIIGIKRLRQEMQPA